jgi:GTPase SAR1 family protein
LQNRITVDLSKTKSLRSRSATLLAHTQNPAGEVKVVVVGNGCVGKTSMIQQFCKGVYRTDYKKTIGVDFLEKIQ